MSIESAEKNRYKINRGEAERKETIMEKLNNEKARAILNDPLILIEHSARKITFVREFFNHNVPEDERWTEEARAGFHQILSDIEDDLDSALHQLLKTQPQHLLETVEAARGAGKI